MKRQIGLLRMLLLVSGLTFVLNDLSAQQSNYVRQPGYWTFGLNGGFAYQDSDVPLLLKGWGAGATLGKNLYYAPNAPLSFDLRGRFLYSQTYGLDHARSFGINRNEALNGQNTLNYTAEGGGPGFVFQNHKTNQAELGLEGVINFNQLRERSNVLFSIYGGLNLDWYKASIDQSNSGGQYDADYLNIAPNRSVSSIRNELRNNILDGDYETDAHGSGTSGNINFMPSLGVELGYQLTPTFSMGIGHKMTFARTDLLDGHQWDNNNNLTGDNDIHHYTSLHMRWELQPERKQLPAPLITITQPNFNPHKTGDPNAVVRATIKHVNSAVDVSATLNGRYQDFDFRGKNFTTRFLLEPGSNELVIEARNSVGSDRKKVIIIYQEETWEPEPKVYPSVRFTNPPQSNYQVRDEDFNVRANIAEVENKNDVRFYMNDREVRDFTFNAFNDDFSARVRLRPGNNTFRIEGNNRDGKDMAETSVFYEEEIIIDWPTVNITQPNRNELETAEQTARIRANITGVNDKRDIRFELNGQNTTGFSFDGYTLTSDIRLREGRNSVEIIAQNEGGEARDEVTIYYQPIIANPPRVNITKPNREFSQTEIDRVEIRAEIRNVEYKNDIELRINGRSSSRFDWNASSGTLRANIDLREGDNTIIVRASNQDGTDEDQVRIRYERPVEPVYEPRAKITSHRDRQSVNTEVIRLRGQVDYVDNRNGVNLYLNGREVRDFTFRSGQVESNLRLNRGNNTIRLVATNIDGTDRDEITINYSPRVNPPSVRISRPTNGKRFDQASIDFLARVENVDNKNDIDVVLNGKAQRFDFSNRQDEARARLTLQEGRNTIRISAQNDGGSDSDEVTVYYERRVERPTVSISRPTDNSRVNNPRIALSAKAENVSRKEDVNVYLNGDKVSNFTFFNGSISANLGLREGRNTIKVTAKNEAGSADDEVRVTYGLPVAPPEVKITTPRPSRFSNTDVEEVQTVKASIKNVDRKEDVSLFLNGRSTRNFDYRNGQLVAQVKLISGKNTIKVSAKNEAGSDDDEVRLTYVGVAPPEVQITSPRPSRKGGTDVKERQTVKATIKNVDRKEDVSLSLNGKSTRSFEYRNGELTAEIKLRNGKNTIKVTAKNKAGRDEDQVILTYIAPAPIAKPTVKIISPSGKLKSDKVSLKAEVTNVKSKKNITVLLNGKKLTKFEYVVKTKQLTANFTIKPGDHKITIIASNEAGKAVRSTNFSYEAPKPTVAKPQINSFTNSSPVINPMRPNSARTTIRATITGVDSKKGITMRVNGEKFNGFTFDKTTGKLTAPIVLQRGKNTIILKVQNATGTVKESKTIIF